MRDCRALVLQATERGNIVEVELNTLLVKGLEGPPTDGPLESIRAQRLPLACVFLDDIGYVGDICSDLGVWVRLGLLLWLREEKREARLREKSPSKKLCPAAPPVRKCN